MTRVFLSFASADSAAAAERFARLWASRGIEVFSYDDPSRAAGKVIDTIEAEVTAADVFVVLMSPRYMESDWCRRERDLAIRREQAIKMQFVYVVEVEATTRDQAGMLSAYVWLDAKGPPTDRRAGMISAQLPLDRASVTVDDVPDFRNRDEELARLLGDLQTIGGRELWVVVSPPLMGKTWLLAKVEQALTAANPLWLVHHLDLRGEPLELRSNTPQLVGRLLRVDTSTRPGPLLDDDLLDIAAEVSARGCPQLFVLDSAELLSPATAAAVRAALGTVHRLVRRTGRVDRLGLVIGTRRHDDWRGLGADARIGERFEPLRLTEFGIDIVYKALLDLRLQFGADQLWSHAERLHRLSEGLPALLVESVRWAQDTAFLRMAESDGQAAFDAVARDYIQNVLLTADSLLPIGTPRPAEAVAVLESVLRVLSTYRLYTQSHLKFHLDTDPGLQQAVVDAHWSRVDLWTALGQTALGTHQAAHEMWHAIEPSLRRLLHRYHLGTDDERIAAHSAAVEFYSGWIRDQAAGREQQVVLVETLWHEASRLAIEDVAAMPRLLPDIAVRLAETFGASPMYEPAEFTQAVIYRLRYDDEFRLLLAGHKGLFEEIVKVVALTIGGGQ